MELCARYTARFSMRPVKARGHSLESRSAVTRRKGPGQSLWRARWYLPLTRGRYRLPNTSREPSRIQPSTKTHESLRVQIPPGPPQILSGSHFSRLGLFLGSAGIRTQLSARPTRKATSYAATSDQSRATASQHCPMPQTMSSCADLTSIAIRSCAFHRKNCVVCGKNPCGTCARAKGIVSKKYYCPEHQPRQVGEPKVTAFKTEPRGRIHLSRRTALNGETRLESHAQVPVVRCAVRGTPIRNAMITES